MFPWIIRDVKPLGKSSTNSEFNLSLMHSVLRKGKVFQDNLSQLQSSIFSI